MIKIKKGYNVKFFLVCVLIVSLNTSGYGYAIDLSAKSLLRPPFISQKRFEASLSEDKTAANYASESLASILNEAKVENAKYILKEVGTGEESKIMALICVDFIKPLHQIGISGDVIGDILYTIVRGLTNRVAIRDITTSLVSCAQALQQKSVNRNYIEHILKKISITPIDSINYIVKDDTADRARRLINAIDEVTYLIDSLKDLRFSVQGFYPIIDKIASHSDTKEVTDAAQFFIDAMQRNGLVYAVDFYLNEILLFPDAKDVARRLGSAADLIEPVSEALRATGMDDNYAGYIIIRLLSRADSRTKAHELINTLSASRSDQALTESTLSIRSKISKVRGSILELRDRKGEGGRGSAFVVANIKDMYIALTNSHVVRYIDSPVVVRHRNRAVEPVTGDLAVLAIPARTLGEGIVPIKLVFELEAEDIATLVSGSNITISSGRFFPLGEDLAILMGARTIEGDSGSPWLLQRRGELVAVAVNAKKGPVGERISREVRDDMLAALENRTSNFIVDRTADAMAREAVKEFLSSLSYGYVSAGQGDVSALLEQPDKGTANLSVPLSLPNLPNRDL